MKYVKIEYDLSLVQQNQYIDEEVKQAFNENKAHAYRPESQETPQFIIIDGGLKHESFAM